MHMCRHWCRGSWDQLVIQAVQRPVCPHDQESIQVVFLTPLSLVVLKLGSSVFAP